MSAEGHWFPNFCRGSVVFSLMVIAELVVVIMILAPGRMLESPLRELAISSLFAQWVVLLSAVTLCKLRPWLNSLPVRRGIASAYVLVVMLTALATWLAITADRFGAFGLTAGGPDLQRYLVNNVLITALVAAAALRYYYIQQQWRRDIQTRSEAQIRALQARIRPHFLFNSMNTIASLIRRRPEVAEQTVIDLSELFRAALAGSGEDSTLGQELSLCRRYLDIEQLRLGERMQVDWQVDGLPRLEPLPPLILQPLFENAVYHGIQPLPEGGVITVRAAANEVCWKIWIRNPKPAQPRAHHDGNQIALGNIAKRLEHRFGGDGKLIIDDSDDYFEVCVRVPIRRQEKFGHE